MAKIIFFEKTGCINNTKQKKLLTLAGHEIEAINLIEYPWTEKELLSFFDGLKVEDCFNKNAPAITSGKLDPNDYDWESALDAMLEDHLLIKRPLMIIDDQKIVGFDKDKIQQLVELNQEVDSEIRVMLRENLVDCPQKAKGYICD